jgi:hypothetical protein
MTQSAPRAYTRVALWQRFGPPTDQLGSVNEPRTHEEYGVVWNEKWIYRAENSEEIERVVLWYRYDFKGAFRVKPDGSTEPESVPKG